MDFTKYFGHIKDDETKERILSTQEIPYAKQAMGAIAGTSTKKERVLLTDLVIKAASKWFHLVQSTSDCTAFGAAHCLSILKAFNCLKFGEEWQPTIITELVYAGSRCEIGKFAWRGQGGASGAATAECCRTMGVLPRGKYLNFDFTNYNGSLADKLGEEGIPNSLEPLLKEHPVKTISLVTDVEVALDLISSNYPLTIASRRGFEGRKDRNGRLLRDADGCLKAGGVWPHQMAGVSYDRSARRPKVGIANSWPEEMMTGPLDGLPEGCFWIDLDDFRLMLNEQDSFVYSDYAGFPAKPLNWRL